MAAWPRWYREVLAVCPVLIAILWLAGVAHFRDYVLLREEWLAIAAAAFALHVISRRLAARRPMPALPEGSNPGALAALAATIVAALAAVVGGVFEALVEHYRPTTASLWLRTTWHAACSFAAAYCGFLSRLGTAARRPPPRA